MSYKTEFQSNNTDLQSVLNTINALPSLSSITPESIGAATKQYVDNAIEDSVKTYTATIGTNWTENEDTGVKSQNVAISGVTANHTAKVDHAYTGNGTSEAYATFVTEENQYLEFITNGYAETYNGGITFYIFGDAPTVSIPIIVEVV